MNQNSDGSAISDAAVGPDAIVPNCNVTSGTNVTFQPVASGYVNPVLVTSPPGDARLFVVEQDGRIQIIKNGEKLATPFLDIDARVTSVENERGLLGLAFHPDYPRDPRFFVHYSASSSTAGAGAHTIAEFRVSESNPDVADPDSEDRLMEIPDQASNHNGGMVAFGPDGFLYFSIGDGGPQEDPEDDAQNTTNLLGKLMRIDVSTPGTYSIPPSNPFANSANGPGDPRREIWAYGFRNPWRFSFDRQTGDLWVGDVGQYMHEEVSFLAAGSPGGANFGWRCREGENNFNTTGCAGKTFVEPVIDYSHGVGCSVTGGYAYRGTCMPDLQGTYFYGDFCTANVSSFVPGSTDPTFEFDLGVDLTSFGEDATGELYMVTRNGTIYQLVAE